MTNAARLPVANRQRIATVKRDQFLALAYEAELDMLTAEAQTNGITAKQRTAECDRLATNRKNLLAAADALEIELTSLTAEAAAATPTTASAESA